ncbi:hypothetical protein MKZ15_11905 [Paenibacillus sp. FSL R7-0216]|uniref:hypothetical protein n=1 Tax=Paenibacillus sp. FSL R7-0216 TaxID=2921677 RepID=UPI0030DA8EE8
MNKNVVDPIAVYATYSDIFGQKYDKGRLIEIIKALPLGGIFTILSQLNSIEIENARIRKNYFSYITLNIPNSTFILEKYKDRILYTPQGLLTIWKWLFVYGDFDKINDEINIDHGINLILYLHLIISDYLYDVNDNKDLVYDFFSNMNFNSQQDVGSSMARACVIYDEISKEDHLFNSKEYIDISRAFMEKYGYSIKEFVAIIFAILTSFINKREIISPSAGINLEKFSLFSPIEKIESILMSLSVDIDTIKNWSLENIDNSWNFQLFREKPLLRLDNGIFLSISLSFLYEQIYNQLFFKIRECFSKDNTQIISFIGRCFEKYVERITEEATRESQISYELIKEFSFGNDKSPDCMIRLGDKLLVIEAKSKRPKLDSLINSNPDTIESDLINMIKHPLEQLHNCMKKLYEKSHPVVHGVNEVYLMVVTQATITALPPQISEIYNEVMTLSGVPVKGLYHLDIEEYEWLLAILSNKGAKPIFRILNNKNKLAPYSSFKNFALKGSYSRRRLSYINQKFLHHTIDFGKILVGEEWYGAE